MPLAQLLLQRGEGLRVDVGGTDGPVHGREPPRCLEPDPGARTGDDDGPALVSRCTDRPVEERDLLGDEDLERLSDVGLEVTGVVNAHRRRGRAPRELHPAGRGRLVAAADLQQHRDVEAPQLPPGGVAAHLQHEACRDALVEVVSGRDQPKVPGRLRRRHQRGRAGRPRRGKVVRRAAEDAAGGVDERMAGQPECLRGRRRQRRRQAIEVRHLRDHRRRAHLVGHRDHMTAREGGSPQDDAIRVHLGAAAGVRHRRCPVLVLAPDVEQLPRLARAGTEVAVVEDQHVMARGGEALGIRIEAHLLHPGQAMRHHHARRPLDTLGAVKPARARLTVRGEYDILSTHLLLLVLLARS